MAPRVLRPTYNKLDKHVVEYLKKDSMRLSLENPFSLLATPTHKLEDHSV